MSTAQEGWLIAALDAISQFRATKEPLKNVVKRLITQRHLGSRERANMSDAVYAWSRAHGAGDSAIIDELKRQGISRPSNRQIDEAIINHWLASGVAEQTFPTWFVRKLESAYGDATPALLESLHKRAGVCLAVDTRHVSVAELGSALDTLGTTYQHWQHFEEAICITQDRFRIESLPQDLQRYVWIMDPGSQLVAHLAMPTPGKKILDACAGGGGKCQFLLSRGAKVTALDISEKRLADAKKRCRGEAVHFVVGDATDPPFEPRTFEYILLDAPCSGTGTLRRAPDLLLRLDETKLAGYVALQRQILVSMFKLLKAKGTLVYATCSILPEENREQVAWALQNFKLNLVSERQLLPSQDDSDGFYVAILEKTGD
jgi:16S rRNA (cytosine967-C5)-methyltransferase